jgi:hypothetical protein
MSRVQTPPSQVQKIQPHSSVPEIGGLATADLPWRDLLPHSSDTERFPAAFRSDLQSISRAIARDDPRVRVIRELRLPLEQAVENLQRGSGSKPLQFANLIARLTSSQDDERLAIREEARGRIAAAQGEMKLAAELYRTASIRFSAAVRVLIPQQTELPLREILIRQSEYESEYIPRAARIVDDRKAMLATLRGDETNRRASGSLAGPQREHAADLLNTALTRYHQLKDQLELSKTLVQRACSLDEGAAIAKVTKNELLASTLKEQADYAMLDARSALSEDLRAVRERAQTRGSENARGSTVRASMLLERLAFHSLGNLDDRRAVLMAIQELLRSGEIGMPLTVLRASGFSPLTHPHTACESNIHQELSVALEALSAPLGAEGTRILVDTRIAIERTRVAPAWTSLQGLQPGMPIERRSQGIAALRQLLSANNGVTFSELEDSVFLMSDPDTPFLAFGVRNGLHDSKVESDPNLRLSGFAVRLTSGVHATFTDLEAPNYASSALHEASHILTSVEWGGTPTLIEEKLIDELAARLTDPTENHTALQHAEVLLDYYLYTFLQAKDSALRRMSLSGTSSASLTQHRQDLEEWRTEPYRSRHLSELFQAAESIDRKSVQFGYPARLSARRLLLESRSLRVTGTILRDGGEG